MVKKYGSEFRRRVKDAIIARMGDERGWICKLAKEFGVSHSYISKIYNHEVLDEIDIPDMGDIFDYVEECDEHVGREYDEDDEDEECEEKSLLDYNELRDEIKNEIWSSYMGRSRGWQKLLAEKHGVSASFVSTVYKELLEEGRGVVDDGVCRILEERAGELVSEINKLQAKLGEVYLLIDKVKKSGRR